MIVGRATRLMMSCHGYKAPNTSTARINGCERRGVRRVGTRQCAETRGFGGDAESALSLKI